MKRIKAIKLVTFSLALAAMTSTPLAAQTQQGWRGPTRDGIYPETGLLKEWPTEGPQLLWETMDAGKGYSSPVIVGDKLYVTGLNEAEDKEVFSAYTIDGKQIYQTTYGTPWLATYPDARTTPTIVGDKAYVISGAGEVICIHTTDGKIVWSVDGEKEFGRKAGTWGISECPLVFDGKVIFCPGGDKTAAVALDAATGKTLWESESLGAIANYASPILIVHNGKKQIVSLSGLHAFGINPENGKIEWTFDDWGQSSVANGWEKIAPNGAIYKDGKLFFNNGYNMNSFLLELNADATAVSLVWRNEVLDTHIGGFVLVDGTIYGSNWINNGQGNWVAVDWNTGETKYDAAWGGGKSKGSIVSADGMLYIYEERRGTVGLVKATPEKFDVVSEFRITKGEGPHWAHPVVQDGVLYMRHGTAMMAYKVK